MNLDPSLAVWIALALNAAGVAMMLGAKRQQLNDVVKRMDGAEDDIDRIEREKLAVADYRREHGETNGRITELDHRLKGEIRDVHSRCTRIEARVDNHGGGRR